MLQRFLDYSRGIQSNTRSPKWDKVRDDFIKDNPLCAVCGCKDKPLNGLEVHHLIPFHLKPELELKKSNLVVLCRQHHLLFGHLMSWKSYNPNALKDIKEWNDKIKDRI